MPVVWIVIAGTSLWMYFDSRSFDYDKAEVKGIAALSPTGWFLSGLFLWIVALPLYIAKRAALRQLGIDRRARLEAEGRYAPQKKSPVGPTLVVTAAGLVTIASLGAAFANYEAQANSDSIQDDAQGGQEALVGVAPAAPEPAAPTPIQLMGTASTLSEAVRVAGPYFADTTNDASQGSMLLAVWMSQHASSLHLQGLPGLTLKHVKKDIRSARGSVVCVTGDIVQIERVDAVDERLFAGTLATDSFDYVHYYAAGSSGTLVDGDRARICGVVTGIYAYNNVSGGQTQSVQLTGQFDLSRSRGSEN